jgi:hypothetical protein
MRRRRGGLSAMSIHSKLFCCGALTHLLFDLRKVTGLQRYACTA